MTTDFEKCLDIILDFEGGYSNNPNDPGGETNLGIEASEYLAWCKAERLTPKSMRDLEKDDVSPIYKAKYWDAVHADYLPYGLALTLFDSGVNCGVGHAIKWLQAGLGINAALYWNNDTSSAYQAYIAAGHNTLDLADGVLSRRLDYYTLLGKTRATLQSFEIGWDNRVALVKKDIHAN